MSTRKIVKLLHDGAYVAKVEVELIEDDHEWSPSYSLADALKLERVQKALKDGDIEAAAREAKVFELTPVATDASGPATTSTAVGNKGREAAE